MQAVYKIPHSPQQTQNISITFIQRRRNVFDVGPTLYKYLMIFLSSYYPAVTGLYTREHFSARLKKMTKSGMMLGQHRRQ